MQKVSEGSGSARPSPRSKTVNAPIIDIERRSAHVAKPNTDQQQFDSSWRLADIVISVATVVLAVVAVLQVLVSKTQERRMTQTIEKMNYIAVRQLRAYVSVRSTKIILRNPNKPGYEITIRNTGQTPADEVRFWTNTYISAGPLSIRLPEPTDGRTTSTNILGAGDETAVRSGMQHSLSQKDLLSLQSRSERLYVYGKVTYRDTFGFKRVARFRRFFEKLNSQGRAELVVDSSGNEAD